MDVTNPSGSRYIFYEGSVVSPSFIKTTSGQEIPGSSDSSNGREERALIERAFINALMEWSRDKDLEWEDRDLV